MLRSAASRLSLVASLALGLGVGAGCSGEKPSEDQCGQFADHLVKLLQDAQDKPSAQVRALARNHRDKIVESCVQEGTVAEVECVLGQETLAGVEENCK